MLKILLSLSLLAFFLLGGCSPSVFAKIFLSVEECSRSGLGDSDVVTQVVRFTVQSLRVKTVDHTPEALVSCDSNYRIESRDT